MTDTDHLDEGEAPRPDTAEGRPEAAAEAGDGPGREAARYRVRLRAAEAERDALAARVQALQRATVDRLATDAGYRPEAVWAAGVDLAALVNADGIVDETATRTAIAAAADRLGLATTRQPMPTAPPYRGPGKAPVGDRWARAFSPRAHDGHAMSG